MPEAGDVSDRLALWRLRTRGCSGSGSWRAWTKPPPDWERLGGKPLGEQDTKAALISPVLRALGWDVEDVEQVRHEYRHQSSDRPVDYALR